MTRDTHGGAIKATKVGFEDRNIDIFKDPKTDSSKKSAKGLIRVIRDNGKYIALDEQTEGQYASDSNCLEIIYSNGEFVKTTTLAEVRKLVHSHL